VGWVHALDGLVARLLRLAQPLVLPLSLLLFLQWPLREVVHVWSREANDLGQCLFALYVSCAIAQASRSRAHLAADAYARRYPAGLRSRLQRAAALVVLLPWAAFMLYAGGSMIWQSVLQLEAFPETFNPGYFVVKSAVGLLALLVLLQALIDLGTRDPHS
jgi:TRAP-type C4-dicarboxylate transport system permease small subunit